MERFSLRFLFITLFFILTASSYSSKEVGMGGGGDGYSSLAELQTAVSNDFHNLGGTDAVNDSVSGAELDGVFSTTGVLQRTSAETYSTLSTDASGDCGASAVCIGGHTHSSYLTAEVDGSTTNEIEVVDEVYNAGNFNNGTTQAVSQDDLYDQLHIGDTDDDGKINVLDLTAGLVETNASGVVNVATAGTDYYAPSSTDVALADGGTGASLSDPNADRIMFWDDSAGATTFLTAGSGLSISGTTITANSTGVYDHIYFFPQQGKVGNTASPATIDGGLNRFYLLFDKDTDESADFQFVMPSTYNSSLTLTCTLIFTTPGITTGNIVWNVSVMANADGEVLETDSFDTTNAASAAVSGTNGGQETSTITLSNKDSVGALELATLRINRDANHASDTAAADAKLAGILLEWT